MQIDFLADRPEFLPILAEWHHAEWAYLRPGETLDARILRLEAACGRREPSVAFVAAEGDRLLGSAMLLTNDMDTRPNWSPWLAGVFIAPEFRRQGIGGRLSRHVIQHAAVVGFRRLYLYTPAAQAFYARLGWIIVERTGYRGTDITVMSHDEKL